MTEPMRPLEALIARWRYVALSCRNLADDAIDAERAAALRAAAVNRDECANELAALLQAAAPPAPQREQLIANLEWVLKRAEEIVRDEHGRDAAYAFTQAWLELPDPDELSSHAPPAPTAEQAITQASLQRIALDFQRARADKWVEIAAQRAIEIEQLQEQLAAAAPPEQTASDLYTPVEILQAGINPAAPPAPTAERIETMVVVTCGQRGFKTILPATDYNRVLAMLSDLAAPPAPTAERIMLAALRHANDEELSTDRGIGAQAVSSFKAGAFWMRGFNAEPTPAAPPERVSEGKE